MQWERKGIAVGMCPGDTVMGKHLYEYMSLQVVC